MDFEFVRHEPLYDRVLLVLTLDRQKMKERILIGEELENCPFESFDQTSVELASQLAPCFRAVAERQGCLYLDAASVASPGSDQLHMDAASHRALAEKLCEMVRAEFE